MSVLTPTEVVIEDFGISIFDQMATPEFRLRLDAHLAASRVTQALTIPVAIVPDGEATEVVEPSLIDDKPAKILEGTIMPFWTEPKHRKDPKREKVVELCIHYWQEFKSWLLVKTGKECVEL